LFEPVSSKLVSFRHVYEIFGGKPLIKTTCQRERKEFWVEKEGKKNVKTTYFFNFYFL